MRNPAAAKPLLDSGARFSHTAQNGQTALMFACRRGATQLAELLTQAGCDARLRDSFGKNTQEYIDNLLSPGELRALTANAIAC
jgi:ankyrin repeat protein